MSVHKNKNNEYDNRLAARNAYIEISSKEHGKETVRVI